MSGESLIHSISKVGEALRQCGLMCLAAVAVTRCIVFVSPGISFDFDPAFASTAPSGIGPGAGLVLDLLLVASCAAALAGEVLTGRGIDWLLVALALVPAPIVFWHGGVDGENLRHGSTWLAAAVSCATAAHLARDRQMRHVLMVVLLAVIGPLLVRGAMQLTIEHDQTVALYEKDKATFLLNRGWEPGSPQALIFERRLKQAQPTGWFVTSNVYASVIGAALVFWTGMVVTSIRSRKAGWQSALAAIVAAMLAGMLVFTGSKGGVLAAAAGAALVLAPIVLPRLRPTLLRLAPVIGVVAVVAVLAAVVVRGAALPEGFAGEKSLLFRWHYLLGAARMIAQNPGLGVGPAGFQQAYQTVREARSPEEVVSAHSVFVDWLAMLGIAGAAWIALTIIQTVRAGREVQHLSQRPPDEPLGSIQPSLFALAITTLLAMGLSAYLELPTLISGDPLVIATRAGALVTYLAAALLALGILRSAPRSDAWFERWILLAIAVTLLMHGQIEMTFAQPGAVVWSMAMVGTAGSYGMSSTTRRGVLAGLPAALVVLVAAWPAVRGIEPTLRQESLLRDAAVVVSKMSDDNAASIDQRRRAATLLEEAYEAGGRGDAAALENASEQLLLATVHAGPGERAELAQRALQLAQRAVDEHGRASSIALAGALHAELAKLGADGTHWKAAIGLARRLTEIDPRSPASWRRLGDWLWESGDKDAAVKAYRTALECDANFELDELKQMPRSEREDLERRIHHRDSEDTEGRKGR